MNQSAQLLFVQHIVWLHILELLVLLHISIIDHELKASFEAYVSSLPTRVHPHLKQVLDWDHGGVDIDLMEIAHHMLHWEERLSPYLELTEVDIHDIHDEHRGKPELERYCTL